LRNCKTATTEKRPKITADFFWRAPPQGLGGTSKNPPFIEKIEKNRKIEKRAEKRENRKGVKTENGNFVEKIGDKIEDEK
jgi:hypothetical protein